MKENNLVRVFFDGYAPKWDSLYGKKRRKDPVSLFIDEVLRRVIKVRFKKVIDLCKSDKVQSVLDAGCGSGQYLAEFSKLGIRATGLDFADSMLDLARDLVGKEGNSKLIDFVKSDYIVFRPAQKFEAIVAIGFYDYIDNPVLVLKKMQRDASKFIYASFPKSEGLLAKQRVFRYRRRNCPLWLYSYKRLNEVLSDAGLLSNSTIFDLGRDRLVRIRLS